MDRRWGYGERGWTVEERDDFVKEMREGHGARLSHEDGRMQSVRLRGVHITFGDRPEDKSRVWANVREEPARWLNGGPDEWARVLLLS